MTHQFRMINKVSKRLSILSISLITIVLSSELTSAQTKDSETQTNDIKVTGVEYGSRGLYYGRIIDPSRLAPKANETQIQFSAISEELYIDNRDAELKSYFGVGGSLIEVAKGFDSGFFAGGQVGYLKGKYTLSNWTSRMEGVFDPQLYFGYRQVIGSSLLIYRLDSSIYSGIGKYVVNSNSFYTNALNGGNIIQPSFDLRHQLNPDFEIGGRLAVAIFGND